tara:strand:+ start:63 stop:569 length:507 start_codon:yes stop_codon:yes gene_type:complete
MIHIFLIIHVVIALALCAIVLLQRSDTDGFGLGSGSGSNFMSGRQSANFMTRATAVLAALFMLNSLWLSMLAADQHDVSLVDRIQKADQSGPAMRAEGMTEEDGEAVPEAPIDEAAPEAPTNPLSVPDRSSNEAVEPAEEEPSALEEMTDEEVTPAEDSVPAAPSAAQ